MLNVAVVGSGPAGLYAAEALVKQAAALPVPVPVRVDVIDRLPTPYGLVRYGVAPDHKSIKSIAQYLRKVLESPGVRFAGGVHLGEDVTREDLLSAYDAVIYATGAMRDRRLGIPGEYVAGWLKRGPTGVIGTNKADAAETVRALLADLAGGPGEGDAPLPRPGLLRFPQAADAAGAGPDGAPPDGAASPLTDVLAARGVRPVSYAEWLRIESAEADLAKSLGRGERVKLPGSDAIWSACWPDGSPAS